MLVTVGVIVGVSVGVLDGVTVTVGVGVGVEPGGAHSKMFESVILVKPAVSFLAQKYLVRSVVVKIGNTV